MIGSKDCMKRGNERERHKEYIQLTKRANSLDP